MPEILSTPITSIFKIKAPVILAAMNDAGGPKLAAAVSNAGGLGVIGGVEYMPKVLREQIQELKAYLKDKNAAFGIDLLFPECLLPSNAQSPQGNLRELIDIIIEERASLFVNALGIVPKWAVDKLHEAGIYFMSVCRSIKDVERSVESGCDIVSCLGDESAGYTGLVPTSILIPKSVDALKGKRSPMTGNQIPIVAGGGIFDGRGLAMALSLGASGVWVGTRFICAEEAGAGPPHQTAVLGATYDSFKDMNKEFRKEEELVAEQKHESDRFVMGKCAAAINEVKTAKDIIDDMVSVAVSIIKKNGSMIRVA